MSFDSCEFRTVMGHFCSGVTVISAVEGGDVRAITASAFTSVSLSPPLVLICVDCGARINDMIQSSKRYAVSILTNEQSHIADRFGRRMEKNHFAFEEWNGLPVIPGALAHLAADVSDILDGGDHHIYLGQVTDIRRRTGEPLLFFRGGYHERSDRVATV